MAKIFKSELKNIIQMAIITIGAFYLTNPIQEFINKSLDIESNLLMQFVIGVLIIITGAYLFKIRT